MFGPLKQLNLKLW